MVRARLGVYLIQHHLRYVEPQAPVSVHRLYQPLILRQQLQVYVLTQILQVLLLLALEIEGYLLYEPLFGYPSYYLPQFHLSYSFASLLKTVSLLFLYVPPLLSTVWAFHCLQPVLPKSFTLHRFHILTTPSL